MVGKKKSLKNKTPLKRRTPVSRGTGRASKLPEALYRRLYDVAKGAIRRCTDPKSPSFDAYGRRGIRVHPPWVQDRNLFVSYLARLPGHDDSYFVLDRIDNDGHYEPGNLRFVDRMWSNINRRPFAHNLSRDILSGRFQSK